MAPRYLLALIILFCLSVPPAAAQRGPVAGTDYTVRYYPPKGSPLVDADRLQLVSVFDFWHIRYGTRLALWYNVLHPDTTRVLRTPMKRDGAGWSAIVPIPGDAALLSYIVSDGETIDGNNEETWVRLILGPEGKPVRNAHFYKVSFLRLADSELGEQVREAEREIIDWPDNFQAYHQYFSLALEQGKGSVKIQQRIVNRIERLQKKYGADPGFLNMAAKTSFYLLQNYDMANDFRENIPASALWPEVTRIFDREGKAEAVIDRKDRHEQRRKELLGSPLPSFNLLDAQQKKVLFPRPGGHVLVLNFWATTSAKSKEMLHVLGKLHDGHGSENLDVFAVNLDVERDAANDWFASEGFPYGILFNNGDTLHQLGVSGIPQTYVVDRDGVVRHIIVGYSTQQAEQLERAVSELL